MPTKRCLACGTSFLPRRQSPNQKYCSAPTCQRERRRRWEQAKRHTDSDYRENQRRAQEKWLADHPDYWRNYRADHPAYTERNRVQQRERNRKGRSPSAGTSQSSLSRSAITDGIYKLSSIPTGLNAKMDSWIVEIRVVSTA